MIFMFPVWGSGGTLQGIAKYLLEQNPDTKIVAVEPKGVSALHGDGPGIHQIQGIGDGFIPDVLDTGLITDVVEVSDEDAINTARKLAKRAGAFGRNFIRGKCVCGNADGRKNTEKIK